jgi:hypothetical protein
VVALPQLARAHEKTVEPSQRPLSLPRGLARASGEPYAQRSFWAEAFFEVRMYRSPGIGSLTRWLVLLVVPQSPQQPLRVRAPAVLH